MLKFAIFLNKISNLTYLYTSKDYANGKAYYTTNVPISHDVIASYENLSA